MRNIVLTPPAFEHYQYWQENDSAVLRKLNQLLRECQRTPFVGTGKPEPLKGELSGFWSRRITQAHRLVYEVDANNIFVTACRFHYKK